MNINFEWGEHKNQLNIRKHELDFIDACELFEQPMLVLPDNRQDYRENGYVGMGFIRRRLVVVVFTEPKANVIRIISLRKANKREQEKFKKSIKNRLEKS